MGLDEYRNRSPFKSVESTLRIKTERRSSMLISYCLHDTLPLFLPLPLTGSSLSASKAQLIANISV